MPRGDHRHDADPFRTWVVQLDDAHRLRVGRDVAAVVPWLDLGRERIDCVGMPGPNGGMQIEPVAGYEEDLKRLRDAMGDALPTARESGQQWTDIARLLATAWRMTINVEATRISTTLPEPARRSRLLPQAGATVILFGFGDILEVWDAAKWLEHVHGVAGRRPAAVSAAIEDLGRR